MTTDRRLPPTPMDRRAPAEELHRARLAKCGSTLDHRNVQHVIDHIADYPEIVAAVDAYRAALNPEPTTMTAATKAANNPAGHGAGCAGCLHVGLIDLVSKYERLADNPTARFPRAEDVADDLRSLLPTTTADPERAASTEGSDA